VQSVIGHYRILEKLGAGGMGEVYLAEDSKLGRRIALKVLPPELAASPERLQRFESEARAVAALNHPNIVTVHSVEEADGIRFITMELVRGKTLTTARHRMTLGDFFEVAVPLADALSAAHQQGIVHRDLKPDNVMVTDEGRVKILDFGLAKMRAKPSGDSEPFALSHLPTKSVTSPGVIVGTVAYMSPEQAEGKGVDSRSDIFALGIILYQLLAGRHPFPGDSAASVLSGILKDTPPLVSELDSRVPHELSRIVRRSLEKGVTRRYQSAIDLRNDLQEVKEDFESGALEKRATLDAAPAAQRLTRFLPWALALFLGAAAVATMLLTPGGDVPSQPVRRFVIRPPADSRLTGNPILSPDGSQILFAARQGDRLSLYLHSLDQFAPRQLEGTDAAYGPFFSPDGEWVGLAAEGKLKKVPLSGGEPVTLCDAIDVIGAAWGEDGIVFGSINVGLRQVSAEGGEPELFLKPDTERGELDFHYPQILPGGEAMLLTRHDKNFAFGIEVYSFATRQRKRLLEDAFYGRYTPTGHLVYAKGYSLFAAPFDLGRMEVSGTSVLVVENVNGSPKDGQVSFSMAEDGTLVYVPRPSRGGRSLVWVDRNGREEPLPLTPRAFSNPRLSPDGRQLALSIEDADRQDVWVFDLERDTEHRVTFEGVNESPMWTPDGSRLTFTSGQDGPRNLFWKPADGSGVAERLTESNLRQWPSDWSPDGKTLSFMETDPSDYWSLALLRLEGEPRTEPLTRTRGRHNKPRFSPDGRWIAYASNDEVYIQPFPGPGGPRQISTNGGVEPIWAPNGRELFYLLPGRRNVATLLAVAIETSPSVRSGRPQKLFELRYVPTDYGASYDIAPDGRFLMMKPSEDEVAPLRIQLVQGWFEELRRRVPTSPPER
jgi:serine/threonine-protein kinase